TQLHELRLTAFVDEYEALAQDAARAHWSHEKYLATLTDHEVARRTKNRRIRRIKEAHFPVTKELADFDFDAIPTLNQQLIRDLARGRYLQQAAPIIMVGTPGLGKTHLATALGLAACRDGHRVRFYTVTGLVNDLQQAQNAQRLTKFIDQALRHKLIILDELGYIPFSTTGAQLLFQFCSALHERVSLIVTTNLPFGDWIQVFGDERLTTGLLDRITYKAHILEFVGESYRFRQRLDQHKPLPNDGNADETHETQPLATADVRA
ncbi:MAG: IS21-like element helper ATPase IstB, partial [Proteobacteria bacterium]|nr:IS21-like element helper ATPase IstB [Pseudomonadota bacterium]